MKEKAELWFKKHFSDIDDLVDELRTIAGGDVEEQGKSWDAEATEDSTYADLEKHAKETIMKCDARRIELLVKKIEPMTVSVEKMMAGLDDCCQVSAVDKRTLEETGDMIITARTTLAARKLVELYSKGGSDLGKLQIMTRELLMENSRLKVKTKSFPPQLQDRIKAALRFSTIP